MFISSILYLKDGIEGGENGNISDEESNQETQRAPWQRPDNEGILAHIWWLVYIPMSLLFFLTIPDVRCKRFRNWYPLSFALCMGWIGTVSYLVTW